jgi:hypothetical protein
VTEEEVLSLAQASLRSVWALEVLLLMRSDRGKVWNVEELIHETRSSITAVDDALSILWTAGIVAPDGSAWCYAPKDQKRQDFADEIAKLYGEKPTTVIKAILAAPQEKLRIFSNSFKFKE